MTPSQPAEQSTDTTVESVVEDAVAVARRWSTATSATISRRELRSTGLLAQLVQDAAGVEFTMRFVDRVARPEDDGVAARELKALATSGKVPAFISPLDRALLAMGGVFGPLLPGVVVPAARWRLRQMVGHLVVDAADPTLGNHIARARAAGYRLNLNLLGEAVLGEGEASSRLERTVALVRRPDVDYVSIKVSALASQLSTWDHAGSVRRVVQRLTPLLAAAKESGTFVNLDMEEYRDLDLTLDVFTEILMREEFLDLEAGIVIQAYLPDSFDAMSRLVDFSAQRAAAGGADIKVRLVKGANLAMEQVEAELHGWPQAPYTSKEDVDANYVRILDWVLTPERTAHLRLGVAGHNLFHLAMAHLLAERRGVSTRVEMEMLQGMAPAQAEAVRAAVGSVLFYTPVVARDDFDVAISYLVRRLEENAAPQNFLHAVFSSGADPLADAEHRFRASVTDRAVPTTQAHRGRELPRPEGTFSNEPDTDPAVAANREWALTHLAADPGAPTTAVLSTTGQLDDVVATAVEAQRGWGALPAGRRAEVLRAVADSLAAHRGDLLAVMAAEGCKTVAEADPEISEAIDFARYYAHSAETSLDLPGATFDPVRVTAVVPPWNFPVAIPVGGMLAALAAGSAVVIKPARHVRRCGEVAVAAIHQALAAHGVPTEVLQLVHLADGELGRHLVTHPDVEAVVLTGSIETGKAFASWRPGLRLLGETSGKNAIVVTPSADLDLAVSDVVKSAFGHAGQKCSAASLVICVGSVARSRRFRDQLVDATRSLHVGWGTDVSSQMGPVIEPPDGKLLRALTTLEPGERWALQPRRLDDTGRLWSPGIRSGVAPGSWFHLTECFGPVLGVMRAADLDEAIALQNATAFGLTGGLHSLDEAEIAHWLDKVEVGNAYVNRHITGAIVQRQSFGGWKASAVGPGAKAGGPNYVAQLGTWRDAEPAGDPAAWLAAAEASDAAAWATEFGVEHDPSALRVEADVFRYRPVDRLTVRVGADGAEHQVQRVLSAARRAGVDRVELSRHDAEPDAAFAARVAAGEVEGRIRVVGTSAGLREAAAGRLGAVTVLDHPVLAEGRRELLTVLREQALSVTRHRFGHVAG